MSGSSSTIIYYTTKRQDNPFHLTVVHLLWLNPFMTCPMFHPAIDLTIIGWDA